MRAVKAPTLQGVVVAVTLAVFEAIGLHLRRISEEAAAQVLKQQYKS